MVSGLACKHYNVSKVNAWRTQAGIRLANRPEFRFWPLTGQRSKKQIQAASQKDVSGDKQWWLCRKQKSGFTDQDDGYFLSLLWSLSTKRTTCDCKRLALLVVIYDHDLFHNLRYELRLESPAMNSIAGMKPNMMHVSNKGRTGLLPSLVHGGAQRVNDAQSLVEQFEREQVRAFPRLVLRCSIRIVCNEFLVCRKNLRLVKWQPISSSSRLSGHCIFACVSSPLRHVPALYIVIFIFVLHLLPSCMCASLPVCSLYCISEPYGGLRRFCGLVIDSTSELFHCPQPVSQPRRPVDIFLISFLTNLNIFALLPMLMHAS